MAPPCSMFGKPEPWNRSATCVATTAERSSDHVRLEAKSLRVGRAAPEAGRCGIEQVLEGDGPRREDTSTADAPRCDPRDRPRRRQGSCGSSRAVSRRHRLRRRAARGRAPFWRGAPARACDRPRRGPQRRASGRAPGASGGWRPSGRAAACCRSAAAFARRRRWTRRSHSGSTACWSAPSPSATRRSSGSSNATARASASRPTRSTAPFAWPAGPRTRGVQVVDAIRDLSGPRRRRLPGHGDRARRHARRSRPATAGGRAGRQRRHRAGAGGVGTIETSSPAAAGADGVVVGRALLSGAISLAETLAAAAVPSP